MKNVPIALRYDQEKLEALRLYLSQKDLTLENEFAVAMDALYTKYVPANVREYIDLRAGMADTTSKKRSGEMSKSSTKPPDSQEPVKA